MAEATCTGVILAGGRASRYDGLAKGELQVGGRRIVDRAAGALRQVTDALVVVGPVDDGAPLPLPVGARLLRDAQPHAGPLAALATAAAELRTPILLAAWDMPFLSPSLLGELRRVGESGGADAVVPEGDGGRVEPLCAWYSAAAGERAATLVAEGERSLRALLDAVRAERLPLSRVVDFGQPRRLFLNVNTPSELALAEQMTLGAPDALR